MKTLTHGRVRVYGLAHDSTMMWEATFDGEVNWNVPGRGINFADDRGDLPDIPEPIRGRQQSGSGSFRAKVVETLTDPDYPRAGDLVWGESGSGFVESNWDSTLGVGNEVMCYHVEFYDGDETTLWRNCILRGNYKEAEDGNSLEFSWTSAHAYPEIS